MARSLLAQERYEYLLVIQRYFLSPAIQRYYRGVTLCTARTTTHGDLPFYVIEFRFNNNYALAWRDTRDCWVLGEWYTPDEYYSTVSLNLDYFRGNYAFYSFGEVLEYLVQSRPSY